MWWSSWLWRVREFQCKARVQRQLPVWLRASKTLRTHHGSVHPAATEMQIGLIRSGCRWLFFSSIWCEPPNHGREYSNIWLFPHQCTASSVSSFPSLCWNPTLKLRFSWCGHSVSGDCLCFYLRIKTRGKRDMKSCRYTRILFQKLVFREPKFSINYNTKILQKKKCGFFSFRKRTRLFFNTELQLTKRNSTLVLLMLTSFVIFNEYESSTCHIPCSYTEPDKFYSIQLSHYLLFLIKC